MANRAYNGSSNNNFITKTLTYLLAFYIAFAPAYASANAASAFGGWSIGNVAATAGQATINASKEIGGQVARSYAVVAPTASALAKNIARVGAVMAVSVAIQALLGGVDWVLDPANNRVKYKQPVDPNYAAIQYSAATWNAGIKYNSPSEACNASLAKLKTLGPYSTATVITVGTRCDFNIDGNTSDHKYPLVIHNNAPAQTEEKYISYDAVAAEIARRAAAGDPAANDFVADTANPNNWANENDYPVPISSITQQFDTNAGADAPPTTDNPPIDPNAPPTDPTKPFTLPGFCSWAAFICNAMNISNTNSNRAATASEQTRTNTAETNTKLSTMQGELINNGNKTEEMKGAVVNAASAANTAATAQKEATKATTDAVTDLKGEVVNAGSAAKDAAIAQKDATKATTDAVTDLKGEVVNQGTKIGDIATSIKDLISTSIDSVINAITGAKDAVTENTKAVDKAAEDARADAKTQADATTAAKDKAHEDAVAQKEATESQTQKDEKHREWEKDSTVTPDDGLVPVIPFDLQIENPNINFGAQCPAPFSTSVAIMGNSVPMEFSYQPLCSFMQMLRPFIIGSAYILGAYIIAGIGRGGATDG